jgi:hypothetical protein
MKAASSCDTAAAIARSSKRSNASGRSSSTYREAISARASGARQLSPDLSRRSGCPPDRLWRSSLKTNRSPHEIWTSRTPDETPSNGHGVAVVTTVKAPVGRCNDHLPRPDVRSIPPPHYLNEFSQPGSGPTANGLAPACAAPIGSSRRYGLATHRISVSSR